MAGWTRPGLGSAWGAAEGKIALRSILHRAAIFLRVRLNIRRAFLCPPRRIPNKGPGSESAKELAAKLRHRIEELICDLHHSRCPEIGRELSGGLQDGHHTRSPTEDLCHLTISDLVSELNCIASDISMDKGTVLFHSGDPASGRLHRSQGGGPPVAGHSQRPLSAPCTRPG